MNHPMRNFAALVLLLSVPVFAAAQKPKGGGGTPAPKAAPAPRPAAAAKPAAAPRSAAACGAGPRRLAILIFSSAHRNRRRCSQSSWRCRGLRKFWGKG